MAIKTTCEGCGKRAAGGGHRFCRACLGQMLCTPTPRAEIRESSITYPDLIKKKRKKSWNS
jgi:hypothetical protein